MSDLNLLSAAIVSGNRNEAKRLTQEALDAGADLEAVLAALVEGMDVVGGKFQRNEAFVPEMLIASRAMKESMSILEPLLAEAGIQPEHTAVIGTVQGDLHDIGKNLVAIMWKGANFNVVDLGTNVAPEKFVEAAKEHKADIIGLSALLTTTMPAMKTAIEAIRAANLSSKVIIGGAPITQGFADQIGADAFAPDAATAVEVARRIVAVS